MQIGPMGEDEIRAGPALYYINP